MVQGVRERRMDSHKLQDRSPDKAIPWLLDGDPAIRWQALRDLIGTAEGTIERERRKVARSVCAEVVGRREDTPVNS